MPIYRIQAPDGNVYRIEGPAGAAPEDLFQAVAEQNPMAAKTTAELESFKSAPMSLGDTARAVGTGVIGAGKSIVDFFGTGTDISKGLGESQRYLEKGITPERQAEIARRQELQDRAARSGSLFQEAKAFLGGVAEAPFQSLAQAAGSSVPAIVTGIIALPAEAPAALALGVATIAKLAVGAIQGVGEMKGGVFDVVKAEYMKQGKTEKEAEALAIKSSEYSRETAFQTGGAALLGALDAVTGAEPSVAKAMRKAPAKEAFERGIAALPEKPVKAPTRLGQLAKGVAEEAPLEGAQSAFGQYGENVALQQTGADVTPMQGVLGAGLRDAAVGALFGGAASPLSMKSARQDYATDQTLREMKATQEEDKAKDEAFKRYQEQQEATRQNLGIPDKNILALPAPAKNVKPSIEEFDNPVGNITRDELGPEVTKYVDKFRRDNKLPRLKTFSIEDIKDAQPGINPEGEQAAIDSILAAKTGYSGQEQYTPEDIQNAAIKNNVATGTQGFNDFLTKVTGTDKLDEMTQPQLHAAFKSVMDMNRPSDAPHLVLPTGTNATRFNDKQYDAGVQAAADLFERNQGKPFSIESVADAVQEASGLKRPQDAYALINHAIERGDMSKDQQVVYRTYKEGADRPTATYKTKEAALEAAKKQNASVREETLTQIAPAEEPVQPEKVRAAMPAGYSIETTSVKEGETPAEFQITPEGQGKPLTTVEKLDEVQGKIERLTGLRRAEANKQLADVNRHERTIFKSKANLESMEARGLTDTEAYKKAQAAHARAEDVLGRRIESLYTRISELETPLKAKPAGKRTVTRQIHTVKKGKKIIGSFPNRVAAEESLLTQLSDKELDAVASDTRFGGIADRARKEQESRKSGEKGIRVKGTKEGLEAAGVHTQQVEAQLQELKAKLLPMLKKFGLEEVGLNVVRAIENDADGAWGKADKLIRIALQAAEPIKTMRHEALHALKELGFFTPQQWEALKRQADKTWVNTYLKGQMVKVNGKTMTRYDAYANGVKDENGEWVLKPLSPEDILEEAIADAFGSWEGGAKPPPGMMAALFKRMQQFFASLKQALTGAGFESADDIFGKIERGELKAGKEAGGAEAKASLKNTTKGLLNPNILPKFEKIIDDVVKEMGLTPEEFASTSLIHQTGKAGTEQFESDKIGGLPEVVQFLQDQRRKSGLPLLDTEKPADRKIIAKLMATEAMAAIRSGGANLEWYDSIINKTLAMAGLKYSELNTDINARMAFKIATAITSQGLNVEDNLAFAMKVYDQFRQNKKFPEIGQGADQSAMVNNFKLANYLMEDMGENLLRQFLETEFTVDEMRSAGFNIKGELGDEKVLGSSVFGPKIGFGFYSNLNGNFDPVTMDMWFMRTIGRLTGKLKSFKQDLYDAQLEKFRNELDTEGSNGVFANQFDQNEVELAKVDDKAAEALARKVKSAHERDYKANRASFDDGTREKSKLVAVSETMIKSLDAPKDAPANGSERRNLRDIVRQMVDIVEEKYGKRVPPASLQAVIWYPEQELYKSMGVKLRVTSQNYAGAIEKILIGEGYGESNLSAAAKLGSRTAQQLAKSAVTKGSKATGAQPVRLGSLQAEEKEALLERGRKRIVLEEEKETPKRKRVIFEVAPDPNNKALTDKWRSLPNEVRIKISEKIGNSIIKAALAEFGLKGYVDTQVGSYLDDTNPSFALYLDSGDSVAMAKFLGYVLSQDSMMVVSPKEGKGLDKTGAVRINIGSAPASKVDKIYQQLREIEVDGEKPVGGQSYMNGHMVVLNYSSVPTDQLAKLINDKLDDNYEVITEDVYTAFPEKKDYDYANPSSDPRGNAGVLRQASRDLRAEATRLLQKELKQFKPETTTSADEKLSLRTYFPTAEEAESAAYEKAPPGTAEFKRFFGGSTIKEEGRAVPMFHASPSEFDVFRENKPIFISPSASEAEFFGRFHYAGSKREKGKVNVYPLWVRAETPFDFENEQQVDLVYGDLFAQLGEFAGTRERMESGDWSYIEDPAVLSTIKKLGFDSFYVKEGGIKNLAVFNANQVKSITGNIGDFSENKSIKFSLRTSNEPMTKDNVVAAMKFAQTKQPYTNCQLCIQMATGVSNLRSLPKVQQAKIGDVYTFNETKDMASHYAVDVGNGNVVEIEGWGEDVRVIPLSEVEDEYGSPSAIRRPPSSAYTAEKYSLPTYSKDAADAVNRTTTRREEKGFIGRILDAVMPEKFSDLRAQLIDRYARLSYYDRRIAERMGGANLLADVSASSAANFSDLASSVTASAFGVGNRQGGVPVYKNGFTTIDTSIKGGLEILKPLAKFNDPKAYQDYQFWAGSKRGVRLNKEGKEENFTPKDQVWANEIYNAYKAKGVDFADIQSEMNEFNKGLVKYMVDTGVLSAEMGVEYMKYNDYIPFYRQIEGEKTVGPKIFNAISGVKPPKKLKGSEAPLNDFFENFVRNTQSAINSGMKNVAAQRAIAAALKIGDISGAERLNMIDNAPDTVQVLEKGKQVSYRVADQLFINAVKSLNMAEMPLLGIVSGPSNLLRNLVTKDPGFMLANLARDSLSAWITSGANITPIAGTVNNFVQALSGKSKGMQALLNAGILGGYEFSSGTLKSGEALEKDLEKKYGSKGKFSPLRTFTTVWDALEHGTEASDAATRIAIYERVLADTGNEAEALHRSLEVMNFNRKGSSPLVRILSAAIPFLNARVQGLDVFYRSAFGVDVDANAKAKQKAFFVRGFTLMALSAAYFLAVSDDDEWRKQEQETKDNYWILPGIGKFPTPFEVGFLFKTIPERLMALAFKDDTTEDFKKSMQRGLLSTLAFNPIPQVAKPIIEYNADYNFFTQRPILGQGMQGVATEFQVGPNTSQLSQALGKALGMSPIKLDVLIQSYTGTIGTYGVQLIDVVLDSQGNSPHASKRFEQLPIIKRFAADPEARGNITQYYELKNAVDTAVQTENFLLKSGNAEEYAKYVEENASLLAVKGYVSNVEKEMKKYREMRKLVSNAEMTADEKRDALTAIGQAENNMTAEIQTIKKVISDNK